MRRFMFLLAVVGAVLLVSPMLGALPSSGRPTITLDQPDPHVGQAVTFTETSDIQTGLFGVVACGVVHDNHAAWTSPEFTFTQTSPTSGASEPVVLEVAGDCTATLYQRRVVGSHNPGPIAETSFEVSP